jgi:hypothetical protein
MTRVLKPLQCSHSCSMKWNLHTLCSSAHSQCTRRTLQSVPSSTSTTRKHARFLQTVLAQHGRLGIAVLDWARTKRYTLALNAHTRTPHERTRHAISDEHVATVHPLPAHVFVHGPVNARVSHAHTPHTARALAARRARVAGARVLALAVQMYRVTARQKDDL